MKWPQIFRRIDPPAPRPHPLELDLYVSRSGAIRSRTDDQAEAVHQQRLERHREAEQAARQSAAHSDVDHRPPDLRPTNLL